MSKNTIDMVGNNTENTLFPNGVELFFQKNHTLPTSIDYSVQRYHLKEGVQSKEQGCLMYNHAPAKKAEKPLELKFCVSGNQYCNKTNCNECTIEKIKPVHVINTLDVLSVKFHSGFLKQFVRNVSNEDVLKTDLLNAKTTTSFSKSFPISSQKRTILSSLINQDYSGVDENIFVNSKMHDLLLHSLNSLSETEPTEVFTCRFLADENGKKCIYEARDILLENLGTPISIKELSRRVAINECYLKKGFKEVFGATIFDYYQQQRMEHAKYLLFVKHLTVTEVALMLGYSSISHFSTAFKRWTGLKPCELLLRP